MYLPGKGSVFEIGLTMGLYGRPQPVLANGPPEKILRVARPLPASTSKSAGRCTGAEGLTQLYWGTQMHL